MTSEPTAGNPAPAPRSPEPYTVRLARVVIPSIPVVGPALAALANAGPWIVGRWRTVQSFFDGFGRGFARGLRPLGEALAPVNILASRSISALLSLGRGGLAFVRRIGGAAGQALAPIGRAIRPFVGWIAGALARIDRLTAPFHQAFGRIAQAVAPLINPFNRASAAMHRFMGPGSAAQDWSKWGEAVGGAIAGVVVQIARLIGWFANAALKAAEFWNAVTHHAAVAAGAAAVAIPAAAAASAPPPKPAALIRSAAPAPAQAGAPGGGGAAKAKPTIGKVEQHFHLQGQPTDPKALATEMHRLAVRGQRRAAYDEND